MATFTIQGKVLNTATSAPLPNATVRVYQFGEAAPLASALTDGTGAFHLSFSRAINPADPSTRPDVHFKVLQTVDGVERVIYNENPATQSRRNIADVVAVTLKTTEGISAIPASSVARPEDTLFLFTRVGVTGVNVIDTVGATATGYAFPDTSPAAPNSQDANSPFGSTLDIAGWFGALADVYRYKIQYSTDGVTWSDISDPLTNTYYQFALGGGTWTNVSMGPSSEGGQVNVYKLPYVERPGTPWIFPDLIARWDSTKVTNGLYTLRVLGFKVNATGTALEPSVALIIDPSFGKLRLRVDNSPPVSRITALKHVPAGGGPPVPIAVCQILSFTSGRLRIEFEASDAPGHLKAYSLNAMFGANQVVQPPPTTPNRAADSYAAHVDATRHWNGGVLAAEYDSAVYTAAKMPTCAYQFRLSVTKRTTNGYGNIYVGVEDTAHITLQR